MIFLDTNILIELLDDEPGPKDAWAHRTFAIFAADRLLVCNIIVLAEVAAGLASTDRLLETLVDMSVTIADLDVGIALRAAPAFREYRRRGGARTTILPDFLIAAHAVALGADLMTYDRRLSGYFSDLTLITPETHP